MTLNAMLALAKDTTFLGQVQMAAVNYAHAVLNEAINPAQQIDAKRRAFAVAVMQDGGVSMSPRIAYGLATYPGFSAVLNDQADANDPAILSVIQVAWNDLSLITAEDAPH